MLKEIIYSNLFKIFATGLLIRLLIMPFFYHPDIKVYHFQASFLKNGVWNIYDYLKENKNNFVYKEEFVYFPLTYYFLGSYQILASPFLGNQFEGWLNDASFESTQRIGVFRYLFILKLPYLILDLFIGFLLTKLILRQEDKKKLLALWMFNPFSIILIYIFSNVDILIVTLTLLSLIFARKNKLFLAAIMLGVGSGFKAYPIFFLPFLVIFASNIKDKLLILLGGFGTIGLILFPFLSSTAFQEAALVSGLTTRIFQTNIDIGFGEKIILPIIFIAMLYLFYYMKKTKTFDFLVAGFLLIPLVIFSSIHYHIQWLLWAIPFAILQIIKTPKSLNLFIFIGILIFLIPFLYDDKYMNFSLLSVISNSYQQLPTIFSIIQKFYDPYLLQSLIHSVLAASVAVLSYYLIKQDYE